MLPHKGYNVNPSKRQLKTMEIIQNNRGIAVSKAMIQAGYSKATAKNPKNLTRSKAYAQLAAQNNVTIEQYFMNLGLAMQAEKQNQFTGEITPDHAIRLSANKQAEKFLNLEPDQPTQNNEIVIPKGLDEIELQRILLKRSDSN